jgi:hypothetical protein
MHQGVNHDHRPAASPFFNSLLAVAYKDPVLRTEGLASDRLGDAKAFFALTDDEAHHLLCDCHYRGTMMSSGVAARLRSYANRGTAQGAWSWAHDVMSRW